MADIEEILIATYTYTHDGYIKIFFNSILEYLANKKVYNSHLNLHFHKIFVWLEITLICTYLLNNAFKIYFFENETSYKKILFHIFDSFLHVE